MQGGSPHRRTSSSMGSMVRGLGETEAHSGSSERSSMKGLLV